MGYLCLTHHPPLTPPTPPHPLPLVGTSMARPLHAACCVSVAESINDRFVSLCKKADALMDHCMLAETQDDISAALRYCDGALGQWGLLEACTLFGVKALQWLSGLCVYVCVCVCGVCVCVCVCVCVLSLIHI